MKDLSARAKEILDQITYVTIATVTPDGQPWNSPVFAVHDDRLHFYWGTDTGSQKATNIRSNSAVFLVVYDSTVAPGTGEGVYIQATARELTDSAEIERALKLLTAGHKVPYWEKAAITDGPVRLFEAAPSRVWMNDDGDKNGFYVDVRTEVKLND